MKKLLFGFMLLFCLAYGQSVPYGLGLGEGTQILVFTSPNCTPCQEMAKLKDFPITFIGRTENSTYQPYLQDKNDLLARAFRVQVSPTLIVLKDGWEVKRMVGRINVTAKAISLLNRRNRSWFDHSSVCLSTDFRSTST